MISAIAKQVDEHARRILIILLTLLMLAAILTIAPTASADDGAESQTVESTTTTAPAAEPLTVESTTTTVPETTTTTTPAPDLEPQCGGGCGSDATIVITKKTIGGRDGTFNFTGDLGPFSITTSSGSGSWSSSNIHAGTFSITEVAPSDPNWELTEVSCDIATETTPNGVILSVGRKQHVECTFTNTYTPPVYKIKFVKKACDAFSDVRANENAGNYAQYDGTLGPVIPGAALPVNSAWEDTHQGCASVSDWPFTIGTSRFNAGSTTSSLSYATGNTRVVYTGSASITLNDSEVARLDSERKLWVSEGYRSGGNVVFDGTSTQRDESIWKFAELRCGNDALNGDNAEYLTMNDFTADNDYTATCYAYNVYDPATLTIVKKTVGPDGAVIPDETFKFGGDVGSFAITTSDNTGAKTFTDLGEGSYTITEDMSALGPEWSFVGASCTDTEYGSLATDTSATVDLKAGDDVTCTFTNKFTPSYLQLEKVVDGGPASPSDWTLIAKNSDGPVIEETGPLTKLVQVPAGTYDLREAADFDGSDLYTPTETGWSCEPIDGFGAQIIVDPDPTPPADPFNDQVTVGVGQALRCTITNSYTEPSYLTLVKKVDGGKASPSDWKLTATDDGGDVALEGVGPTVGPVQVPAGTYTLSEFADFDGSDRYSPTETGWVCTSSEFAEQKIGPNDSTTLRPGDDVTCTITNEYTPPVYKIKFVKKACDAFGDVYANENAGHLAEHEGTLGPVIPGAALPVNSAWEDANQTCDPVSDWPFTIGTVHKGPGTAGGAGTVLSHADGATRVVYTSTGGATTFTLTPSEVTTLEANRLWISEGRMDGTDLVLDGATTDRNHNRWRFAELRCGNDALNGDNAEYVTADDFTADNDYTATCYAYNVYTPPGSLTIEKKTVYPDGTVGPDGTFNFTKGNQTHDPFSITTVNGVGTYGPDELDAGNYSFTEIAPSDPGWSISGITCDTENYKVDLKSRGTATVHLAQGEHVTCTVTNKYTPSYLTLKKVVVGGPADPEDWTLTAMDDNAVVAVEGDGAVGPVQVPAGTYSLSEFGDFPGSEWYSPSKFGWYCTADEAYEPGYEGQIRLNDDVPLYRDWVNVGVGESWTCVMTNTYVPPAKLTVVKETVGGDGTFDFTGPDGLFSITTTDGSGEQVFTDLDQGSYTVAEDLEALAEGWEFTGVVCDNQEFEDAAAVPPGSQSVYLYPGDDVTCTFINEYTSPPPPPPPAQLTVAVETIGGDGTFMFNGRQDAGFVELAAADLSGFSVTTSGYAGQQAFPDLDAGTYTVTEDLAALEEGWSFVSVSCDDDYEAAAVDGSVTVTIPPGDAVTCTFVNEYVPEEPAAASLTVKLVTRGGAGTFEFNGDQVGAFILKTLVQAGIIDPEAVTTFADLAPGTYGITEKALPAFWHAVSAACDNGDSPTALTLAEGDDVTCTFVVEKDAPSAEVGDTVFLDLNGNGKQDPGEKGINGAKVFLYDADGTLVGTATTANGGVYLFTGLAAGKYTVKLDAKSVSGELTTAGAFTFDLAEGMTYLDADFGLAETLPKTGTDAGALGLLGLMLLAAGAIAVMATRKKREQS